MLKKPLMRSSVMFSWWVPLTQRTTSNQVVNRIIRGINKKPKILRSLNPTLRVREGALVNITVKSSCPIKIVKVTTLLINSMELMDSISLFHHHLLNSLPFWPIHSLHNPSNRWLLKLLNLLKGEMGGHLLITHLASCVRNMSMWIRDPNITMFLSWFLALRTHQHHLPPLDLSLLMSMWNNLSPSQGCSLEDNTQSFFQGYSAL